MTDKVRLAPVGLGRWARVLARGAQRGDVIELSQLLQPGRGQADGLRRGVRRSSAPPSSYEELLADPAVEGVIITTPNDTHKDVIIQALEAGKAVYTDKPIAHTLEDANRIAAAVADTGGVFAVGHSSRRLSGHREMKRWLEDGRIGDISLAEANFSNERGLELTPQTWRYYADKSPGGAFIQLGVHHADTLQFLLGPVKSVTAHARKLYTKSEVPDAIMAISSSRAAHSATSGPAGPRRASTR